MKTVLVLLIASCLMQYGKMEFNFANVLISRNSSVWTIPEPTAEMYIHCLHNDEFYFAFEFSKFANVHFRQCSISRNRVDSQAATERSGQQGSHAAGIADNIVGQISG